MWRQLLPGLVTLVLTAGVVLAILIYARVGVMRGDKARLYARTGAARGLMQGSPVWLAGQRIGQVASIDFAPVSADSGGRVVIAFEVLERHLRRLRRDSDAQVRPGGTLIAAPVVYLTTGSASAAPLGEGDTITTRPQDDFEDVSSRVAVAGRHIPAILEDLKVLNALLREAEGTLGALTIEGGGVPLGNVQASATELRRTITTSGGSLGLALRNRDLGTRARILIARTDSVRLLIAEGRGTLGRFQRDSTLVRAVGELRDEAAIIGALLDRPAGTAGRATKDGVIEREVARARVSLDSLFADIKANPLRYIAF
jgi:hypothetical protein